MMTLLPGRYDPSLGYTIPPSIIEAGLENEMRDLCDESSELYHKLVGEHPAEADYVLTNAHRRRVMVTVNMRELYAISRLREDGHAQWDIRNIAHKMMGQVAEVAPATSLLLCGKDGFGELYKSVYGKAR
jgi:thymidylate synthase ThyX